MPIPFDDGTRLGAVIFWLYFGSIVIIFGGAVLYGIVWVLHMLWRLT